VCTVHGVRWTKAEEQANALLSAFLMPRSSILAHVPGFRSGDCSVKLKKIWQAFRREHSLSSSCARNPERLAVPILYIPDSRKDRFRTREPNPIPRETSLVLPKIFAALREDGFTRQMIQALCIPQSELEA